jgi:hypothetical protein
MKETKKVWDIHGGVWREVAERSGGRRSRFFVWVSRSRNFRSTIMKNERVGEERNKTK